MTAGTLATSAAIAVGNTLEALIGGLLIARWSGGGDTFATPGQVAKFALVGVGPATVVSATIGVVTLCLARLCAVVEFRSDLGHLVAGRHGWRAGAPVETDLGELELALVNIAVNARDAMSDGGMLTLSARNVVLKPGSAAGALSGDFVALAFIDTGTGISPDVLARVFEPFFTTKPVGKGTGLGLSQVHGFANQTGGAVTVNSEVGHGTVVTMYLPRAQTKASEMESSEQVAESLPAQGTVLSVENSRDVAEVTAALLEQVGYRVVRAEDATEALRHLQQGIAFDLLLSDIVMPGAIDGMGLAEMCRRRFPDIAVLLTSGFSDAARAADGRFDILRKPFELSALERALEQAIENARGEGRPRGFD